MAPLVTLLWYLLVATPLLSTAGEKASTVLPPSQDPFYSEPRGFEAAAPGTVLRVRRAPGNLSTLYAPAAAYSLLYRTADSNSQPSWAVTTLFVPQAPQAALLAYNLPYDTASVDQSPSYSLGLVPQDAILTKMLSLGWSVSISDYEGPRAAFLAGAQAGHAVLDGLRAARAFQENLLRNARIAVYGFSGGSLASEWAAELSTRYAPELQITGVAVGGLVANVTDLFEALNGQAYAQLVAAGLLGITQQAPAAKAYLQQQLKPAGPYNASTFLSLLRAQGPFVLQKPFLFQDIFQYFKAGRAILRHPALQEVLHRDGVMGHHGVPRMPLFVVQAIHDEITLTEPVDALVSRYCAAGANIVYERNSVGGHLVEFGLAFEAVLPFLQAVLGGSYESKYKAQGCTIRNVTMGTDNEAKLVAQQVAQAAEPLPTE